jgi:hypothetical protein
MMNLKVLTSSVKILLLDNEAYDKRSKFYSSEEGRVGVGKMLCRLERAEI